MAKLNATGQRSGDLDVRQVDLAGDLLPAESAAQSADLRPGPAPVEALAKYVLEVRQPIEVGTGVVLYGGHERPFPLSQPGR